MALTLEDKKAIVAEVAAEAATAQSLVAADYRGLSVAQMSELRREARQADVYLKITRNTLARRALQDTDFSCIADELKGALVLAFSRSELSAAARLLRDFRKKCEKIEVKALVLDGRLLPAGELEAVAKLPTREEALALLLSALQASPAKLARTLAEPPAKFARTLAAVRAQKEAA